MTTSHDPTGPLLVLAAMAEEAAAVTSRLEGPEPLWTPFADGVTAVRGTLAGCESVVVTTGIGIAAATAAATWGILAHRPRVVIAAGSCGGLAADVEVGTLIVGDAFTYSIADATAFGYAPGQVPGGPERFLAEDAWAAAAEDAAGRAAGPTVPGGAQGPGHRRGLMLSGDAFVTAAIAEPMRERFPAALSADMETTASARTAAALGVPFVALRAVSDLCGPAAGQQFHLELDLVSETSARAVEEFARSLAA
ncbi:5'-methylthioadenosine/S-adenosylhomocysteine nucleosidase [Brachybacterium fresconis]|uniref:adenosylhomocysteine nucleosidase n=1 Tax=Brachybacterium fresconis TaxID=173363 RepID=A0ABS4YPM1_9MICO|nr:5'-methylthioadenosine/S-adenosylhomocysteine nucleosidase [Brachybacterium fresconis]MBP2410420.1 adenosylhomocysteine nucleosidase [Brachybacterium fresconis]